MVGTTANDTLTVDVQRDQLMQQRAAFDDRLFFTLNSARLCGDADVLAKSATLCRDLIGDFERLNFGVELRRMYVAPGSVPDRSDPVSQSFELGYGVSNLAFDVANRAVLRGTSEDVEKVRGSLVSGQDRLASFITENPGIKANWPETDK